MRNTLATKLTKPTNLLRISKTNKRHPSAGSFRTSAAGAVTSLIITLLSGLLLYSSVYADNIPYSITYHDNVVSNMPTDVNDRTLSNTIPISSNTPLRSGFSFLGWCNTVPTDSDGTDTCDGIQYAAGSNYELDQTSGSNNLILYAMWKEPTDYCKGSSYDCMQNLAATSCTTTAKTVIDGRDGTLYKIQKLADNNCWMLDNLALDLVSVSLDTLKGKTHASDGTLGYLKNGGGSTNSGSSLYKYAKNGVANWTSGYSYSNPLISAGGSGNLGDWTKDTVLTNRYGAGSGKVGVYYNYCAASAGSYCYGNGTSYGTSSGNAAEDICPSGWHMPSGNSSGAFSTLAGKYSSTTATNTGSLQYNLSTPLSGYFLNGSVSYQGSYGYWWSSTRNNGSNMYNLNVNASNVNATNSNGRHMGSPMRCVLGS